MNSPRIIFWRSYYGTTNPFRRLYYRIAQPKTRGVKCVIRHQNTFLLVRLAYAHKKWTFPGGGVDRDESYEEGARRELREEAGIDSVSLTFFGEYESRREHKHDTVQCFYGESDSDEIHFDALEITEAGWFRREDFPLDRSDRVDQIMNLYDDWKKL